MNSSEQIEEFWQEFCLETDADSGTSYLVWCFGNTPEMAEELLQAVLDGRKRAAVSLVWEFENRPKDAPILNGYIVVTNFEGIPACVLKLTELRVLPFRDVDAEFAFDEGVGDQSLDHWRQVHWEYFSEICTEIGRIPEPAMPVNCKRFELIYTRKSD
jgi:uncharacterized protein YhfF